MKTQPVGPFLGINNRRADFSLRVKDQGDYVRDAVNVDLDNRGFFRRRQGITLIQAMTGAHSVFEFGERRYLVHDSVLYRWTVAPFSTTLVAVLTSNDRMSYAVHNGDVYYSNGTDSGRIAVDETRYPWAMASPAQPAITDVGGALPIGWYQVGVTYLNSATGEESGHNGTANIELTAPGGIQVTLPGASSGATHVRVYVSQTNGSVPGLIAECAIGTATYDITSLDGVSATLILKPVQPLPAGSRVFVYNGRLCSVTPAGVLYYSEPYRFGYAMPENSIKFEAPITVAVANQFGVYLCADKTRWIPGDINAPAEQIKDVLPYGAVAGTEFEFPDNSKVGWFGARGVVFADSQGQVEPVMSDNVDQTPPASGVSAVLSDHGFWRVVSCDWAVNLKTGAATRYSGVDLTSASGAYATRADGVYELAGADDAGVAIQSTIALGKLSFDDEHHKQLPATYLGVASEDKMQLWVQIPAGASYTYEARSNSDELAIHRVDPGRGLRANWYDLTLRNLNGCDFTLASVSFAAVATTRRI